MKCCAALRLKMPSTLAAIEQVCATVRSWLEESGLHEDWFAVMLLLRESLNNAVKHGNGSDPALLVDCRLRKGPRWLDILVGDRGAGFDWERFCTHKSSCGDTCGRGLEIYRLYADKVVFNRRGNRVLLRLKMRKGEEGGLNSNRAE
ncbi:MAG: ATP-binding protein [Syntrophobacteraceae bacterium]